MNPLRWIRDHKNGRMRSSFGEPLMTHDSATHTDETEAMDVDNVNTDTNTQTPGVKNIPNPSLNDEEKILAMVADENEHFGDDEGLETISTDGDVLLGAMAPFRRTSSKGKKRRRSRSPGNASLISHLAARKLPRMGTRPIQKMTFKRSSPPNSPTRKNSIGRRPIIATNPRFRPRHDSDASSGSSAYGSHNGSYKLDLPADDTMPSDESSRRSPTSPFALFRSYFSKSGSPFSIESNSSGYASVFSHSPSPLTTSSTGLFFSSSDGSRSPFRKGVSPSKPSRSAQRHQSKFETVIEESESERSTSKLPQMEQPSTQPSTSFASQSPDIGDASGVRRSSRTRRQAVPFGDVVGDWAKKKTMPLRHFVGNKSLKKDKQHTGQH